MSLLKTLEITDRDDFAAIHVVADFATLVGTYARGFAIIIEPYDARLPSVPDPVIQVALILQNFCARQPSAMTALDPVDNADFSITLNESVVKLLVYIAQLPSYCHAAEDCAGRTILCACSCAA